MPRSKNTSGRLAHLVSDLRWYAFRTVPQKEFIAQEILKRKGMATFVPVETVYRHANKFAKARCEPKEKRSYPLVRGWLFIGFKPGIPPFYDVFNLNVLTRVVCDDEGCPVPMLKKAMGEFMERYADGIVHPTEERFMRTHGEFAIGDLVRVIDGPFEDHVFSADRIEDRVAFMRHEILGKLVDVPITLDNLVKVEAAA